MYQWHSTSPEGSTIGVPTDHPGRSPPRAQRCGSRRSGDGTDGCGGGVPAAVGPAPRRGRYRGSAVARFVLTAAPVAWPLSSCG
ncbi:hypothetical protein SPW_3435 [Streptomyces sp. W007]|nr:hypothetical protein SPW_3435 [Streptomyces sp. W007]